MCISFFLGSLLALSDHNPLVIWRIVVIDFIYASVFNLPVSMSAYVAYCVSAWFLALTFITEFIIQLPLWFIRESSVGAFKRVEIEVILLDAKSTQSVTTEIVLIF